MANPLPSHSWHAKTYGGYTRTTQEALENAYCIYELLYSFGWKLPAISGVLGNSGYEGQYNPLRWYGDNVPNSTDSSALLSRAYGLCQFYPSTKYISDSRAQQMPGFGPNFLDVTGNVNDGNAQMTFIDGYADYMPTQSYNISYADYKVINDTPENCAMIWLYNYERPGQLAPSDENNRKNEARYWYDILIQYDPDTPTPPTPPTPPSPIPSRRGKLPVWMMIKRIH